MVYSYSSSVFSLPAVKNARSLLFSSISSTFVRLPDLPEAPRVWFRIETLDPTGVPFEDSFSNRASPERPQENSSRGTHIFAVNCGEGSSQHPRLSIPTQLPYPRPPLATASMDGTDARSCGSFYLKSRHNPHSSLLRENINSPSDSWVLDLTAEIYNMTWIAGGGYSSVFQACWKKSQGSPAKVIVKIIPRPESERGDKIHKRLRRELGVRSQLNHMNILPLLGVVSGTLGPGLVSPWYSNGNILQYIQRVPDVPRESLCEDVASGLRYLHEQDPPIVHGDLKGANVLVDMNGRAALCDFGLSAILGSGRTGFTSFVLGSTLRYTAPEEFADDLEGGSIPRDIYSYACVYGQIMTGDPPFHWYRTDPLIMRAICRNELPYRLDSIVSRHNLGFLEPSWDPNPTCRPTISNICHTLGIPEDHPSAPKPTRVQIS